MNNLNTRATFGAAMQYRITLPKTKIHCDHHHDFMRHQKSATIHESSLNIRDVPCPIHHTRLAAPLSEVESLDDKIAKICSENGDFVEFVDTMREVMKRRSKILEASHHLSHFQRPNKRFSDDSAILIDQAKLSDLAQMIQDDVSYHLENLESNEAEFWGDMLNNMTAREQIVLSNKTGSIYTPWTPKSVLKLVGTESINDEDESAEAAELLRLQIVAIKNKRKWRRGFTTPQPFDFQPSQKTSSFKRLEQEIKQLEEYKHPQFKAKEIPQSTLVAKYQDLIDQVKRRSETNRLERQKTQAAHAQSFGVTERQQKDYSATHRKNCPSTHVKPTDIFLESPPKHLKLSQCQLIKTAAEEGRKRKARMLESETKAGITENHTFSPNVNHHIPDFVRLQSRFEAELSEKKGQRALTIAKPFGFVDRPPTPRRRSSLAESLATSMTPSRPSSPTKSTFSVPSSPTYEAKTTKAHDLRVKFQSTKVERESLIQSLMQEEQDRRKEKTKLLGQRLRESLKPREEMIQNTKQSGMAGIRERLIERSEEYRLEVQDILDRVDAQDLLVDRDEDLKQAEAKQRIEDIESRHESLRPWMY